MVCLLPTSSVQTAAQLRASLRDCETVGQYHKALDQALQVMMPPPLPRCPSISRPLGGVNPPHSGVPPSPLPASPSPPQLLGVYTRVVVAISDDRDRSSVNSIDAESSDDDEPEPEQEPPPPSVHADRTSLVAPLPAFMRDTCCASASISSSSGMPECTARDTTVSFSQANVAADL